MPEAAGTVAIATLVTVSFLSFLAGYALRKWPDKIQQYTETIDGSVFMLSPAGYRAAIQASGIALIALSFVALVATRFVA